jgi:hypothetical protein
MNQNPPPQSQPAGWLVAGIKPQKNNSFIHSTPPRALQHRPNQDRQNCETVCGSQPIRPYSELRLVLPSKTPASGHNGCAGPMLRVLSAGLAKV